MKKAIKEEAEKCGDSGPNKMAAQMVITVRIDSMVIPLIQMSE
jgi:hypothetical protein